MARLGIGLPVHDGERYLAEALESLLGQTFGDFELVICDNASTDATAEIAAEYARRDGRVRVHRSPENIGAAPNFNRAFDLCRGAELFKWAAHDDVCAPTYLERCVEALDRRPDAVLAHPRTRVIDEDGAVVEDYAYELQTDAPRAVDRFSALLVGHRCYEVFGVIRRAVLARTRRIGSFSHGDGVLLAELALLGRFVEVPEPLFLARRHDRQSMQMVGDHDSYAAWFDPKLRGRRLFPNWRIHAEFARAVRAAPLPLRERLHCGYRLLHWMRLRRRLLWRELRLPGVRAGASRSSA